MSKKQTIRTLGSIEKTQPAKLKQTKPKKLYKEMDLELDLETDLELDNNIESFSEVFLFFSFEEKDNDSTVGLAMYFFIISFSFLR